VNKKQKIALSTLTIVVIVVGLAASMYYLRGTPTQTDSLPSGKPPQAQLKITGDVAAEETLSIQDLTEMPLTNVTNTIKGETANYLGVNLLDLLNQTSASWDVGIINVIASDGFERTINTYQAFNSSQYSGSEIILAFVKDDKWITDISEGPLKLITPGLESNYNVKSVAEINLKPWTINITGTVTPMVLTGSNITDYGTQTVQAAFAPGGEPKRTSEWAGTSLYSILQAVGIPAGAKNVTVTAIDGYSRDYTISQVQSTVMLVGFKENGQYLKPVDGQPYRLFVPTEDYKWGQYWVRWVSAITVS
jgi:DMSO/TMAO reductase YedYZ molybdopterin-dependent catalytic subunit